jgi:hypothetical protein
MSFLVRQLSRTSDGREIVRAAEYDKPAIGIGRDAGNEIHLADLAVELQHARIERLDNGSVEVASLGNRTFDVDGRAVERAQIDPGVGAELRFGGHRLTLGREDGRIVVNVERVEALSDASEEREEIGLFTLKGLLPGRRMGAWSFALLALAAFLIWPIFSYVQYDTVKKRPAGFHADTTWISGPLSTAHKGLEKDCQACHQQPFVAVRDTACVTCHKDAHDHAQPDRLLVAKAEPGAGGKVLRAVAGAFNRPEGRCVDCHTEHEGAGRMEPTAEKFCSSCHADMDTRLTDTKLANAGDFGKSHPEFRPLVMTAAGNAPRFQRVSLDKKPADLSGLKFPHDVHLSRTNGVAKMARTMKAEFGFGDALACKDCHTATPDGVRFAAVDMERDCAMCHSLAFETLGGTVRTLRHGEPRQVVADLRAFYRAGGPFNAISLSGQRDRRRPGDYAQGRPYFAYFGAVNYGAADSAIRAVFSKGGACYDCHTVFAPPAGSDNWQVMKVHQTLRYMQKGWFDHDAHKTESCTSCHAADKSKASGDLLLPDLKSCRECHGGQSSNADVPSSCALCHSYHADDGAPWVPKKRVPPPGGPKDRIALAEPRRP